jgi:hypothetical protein
MNGSHLRGTDCREAKTGRRLFQRSRDLRFLRDGRGWVLGQ